MDSIMYSLYYTISDIPIVIIFLAKKGSISTSNMKKRSYILDDIQYLYSFCLIM